MPICKLRHSRIRSIGFDLRLVPILPHSMSVFLSAQQGQESPWSRVVGRQKGATAAEVCGQLMCLHRCVALVPLLGEPTLKAPGVWP